MWRLWPKLWRFLRFFGGVFFWRDLAKLWRLSNSILWQQSTAQHSQILLAQISIENTDTMKVEAKTQFHKIQVSLRALAITIRSLQNYSKKMLQCKICQQN